MVHEVHDTIAQKVWAGEYEGPEGALALAESAYRASPDKSFLMFASTLYSGRRYKVAVERLHQVLAPLLRWADEAMSKKLTPDQLDVLATILEWLSRSRRLTRKESVRALAAAMMLCEYALSLTEHEEMHDHTRSLIILTYLRSFPETARARELLTEVEGRVPYATDQNQRARIYRKLGFVHLTRCNLLKGVRYILQARNVPGIAPDVQAKNLL